MPTQDEKNRLARAEELLADTARLIRGTGIAEVHGLLWRIDSYLTANEKRGCNLVKCNIVGPHEHRIIGPVQAECSYCGESHGGPDCPGGPINDS